MGGGLCSTLGKTVSPDSNTAAFQKARGRPALVDLVMWGLGIPGLLVFIGLFYFGVEGPTGLCPFLILIIFQLSGAQRRQSLQGQRGRQHSPGHVRG